MSPRLGRGGPSLRVGWLTAATLAAERATFRGLETSVAMRIANVARWLNRNSRIRNELYRPDRRYDVVVFVKAMNERVHAETERVRAGGGRVVFDANVNYYEIWGDYDLPGTRPTPEQQREAEAMTRDADAVVADSPEEWRAAFERLLDPAERAELGERARQTVEERYSTPVVARRPGD